MHEGKENCERGNKGLRRKIKGTKAYEENNRLRDKINGADSAKGEYTMHEVENKNVKGEKQRSTV